MDEHGAHEPARRAGAGPVCGSGALGLEALSRGAEWVDFVENDPRAFRVLQENIKGLGAGNGAHCTAKMRWPFWRRATGAGHRATGEPITTLRSPTRLTGRTWRYNLADRWLKQPFAAIFGVEHEALEQLPAGGDTRRYGDTSITIYRT